MPSATFQLEHLDFCQELEGVTPVDMVLTEEESFLIDLENGTEDVDSCVSLKEEFSASSLKWGNKTDIDANVKTMIVFDWDDTILSTSHLAAAGYRLGHVRPRNPQVEAALKQLDTTAQSLLQLALENSHRVCIITNAENGWIELSSKSWLPGVAAMLKKFSIISARSTFEPKYPNSPSTWKLRAFEEMTAQFSKDHCDESSTLHIISLGDSNVEREAAHTVARNRTNTKAKSVKFTEEPSVDVLRLELMSIMSRFSSLVEYDNSLDLVLPVPLL